MASEEGRLRIRVFPDRIKLAEFAAQKFKELSDEAIAYHGIFRVALSGGSTPKSLYQRLAEEPFLQSVEWTKVHFFWSDERCVPPDHPESNFRMAQEALLSKLSVSPENIHRMLGEDSNPKHAASVYEKEIRKCFDATSKMIPEFDLILLGMGEDGHTASLFPSSSALDLKRRIVAANYIENLGAWRLTFTPTLINKAACVMFLIAGKGKAHILLEVLQGPPDPERVPAKLVRPRTGELLYLIDRDAASELPDEILS